MVASLLGDMIGDADSLSNAPGRVAQRGFLVVDRRINLSPVLQSSELCSDNPSTAIATFEDANLLALVRSNLGLVSLDDVGLTNTAVSCTDVAALETKGVAVDSDCP